MYPCRAPRTPTFPREESPSREARARRHIHHCNGFYRHLSAYVGVNVLLVAINLAVSPGVFWAIWPIVGWGVKVAIHAVSVFGLPGDRQWPTVPRANDTGRHEHSRNRNAPTSSGERTEDDPNRLRRRVENLEAIVTSADWDLLTEIETSGDPKRDAATLADETIPG